MAARGSWWLEVAHGVSCVRRVVLLARVDYVDAYVTIAEVSDEFRVSREHIRRMCVDERLPAVQVGGVWRIRGSRCGCSR